MGYRCGTPGTDRSPRAKATNQNSGASDPIRSPECPDSVCTSLVYTTFREPDASTKEFSMAQAIALPTRPHYRIDNDIVDIRREDRRHRHCHL